MLLVLLLLGMPSRIVTYAVVWDTMKEWEPFTSSVMKCENHY